MTLLQRARALIHQLCLYPFWLAAAIGLGLLKHNKSNSRRVIFVTADSQGLIGSRGDAAMLTGALEQIRDVSEPIEVFIACATPNAVEIAHSLGCKTFRVWGSIFMPFYFLRSILEIRPDAGFFMGADIMDGHYSPVTSMRMLISSDLVARFGASSRFLGFSLNATVPLLVKAAFRLVDGRVQVNLRDPISLQRHQRIAGKTGHLVADTAFLLKPSSPGEISEPALNWVSSERAMGRLVLGVNFHPMLFSKETAAKQTQKLAMALSSAMAHVQGQQPVSWLLVPHDDRIEAGDMSSLALLPELLQPSVREHTYRIITPPSAGELKTIAGSLDGVITGRMHLAIATLGQGVPVLTFAYQGKFEGLMKHFEFPDWVVVDPNSVISDGNLTDMVVRFAAELPALTAQVHNRLPTVLEATRATFRNL
jgi:colanic acid/amylovoran biosynthesis protein